MKNGTFICKLNHIEVILKKGEFVWCCCWVLLLLCVNPNCNEFKFEDDDIFKQYNFYLYVLRSFWGGLLSTKKDECFSNIGYKLLLAHFFDIVPWNTTCLIDSHVPKIYCPKIGVVRIKCTRVHISTFSTFLQ